MITHTRETSDARKTAPPLVHIYDARRPQPGDVALCGHLKRTPYDPDLGVGDESCLVCIELDAIWPVVQS